MPFLCPACSTPRSLAITSRLELPPDSRSDEITLQVVECARCGFAGLAIYEESRRGSLSDESFDHYGHHIHAADLDTLRTAIAVCPKPRDRRCRCAAHRRLGRKNEFGRWNGLADVRLGDAFRMRF